jgi:hypothetical protein
LKGILQVDDCLRNWDSFRDIGWLDDLLLHNGYKLSSLDDLGLQSSDFDIGVQHGVLSHKHSIFVGCEDLLSSFLETCIDLLPLGTSGQSPEGGVQNLSWLDLLSYI